MSQLYPGFGADLLSGRLLRRIRKHAKRLSGASGDSSDPKVSMNVSVPDADNSYIYAAAQEFKSRVEEYSNGASS